MKLTEEMKAKIIARAKAQRAPQWTQGTYEDGKGHFCQLGWIMEGLDIKPPLSFKLQDKTGLSEWDMDKIVKLNDTASNFTDAKRKVVAYVESI